ncbi:MAG: 4-hydroxythreonine-4-phosphate dehydrogenase PdxA, partial [Akkermansiaceae bacterium]|nr:4-hydroxythreonine-4-phosphate dehydrogenase PdxA [Akkermansiaceae bacterium]
MERPPLAVTMGDPAGIGPELCLELLRDEVMLANHELRVFGSAAVLEGLAGAAGPIRDEHLVDFGPVDDLVPGQVSAATGAASFRYLEAAIEAALNGEVRAIITCPIHKAALAAAGIDFAGHTEILVDKTGSQSHAMMLTTPAITCSLVTTHLALSDVPAHLTTGRIAEVIDLTAAAMSTLHGRGARLAVLGLNPHAGEGGLFGDEESRIIQPAIDAARKGAIDVRGPLPPDTAFLPKTRREVDAYICMYHDQGLI